MYISCYSNKFVIIIISIFICIYTCMYVAVVSAILARVHNNNLSFPNLIIHTHIHTYMITTTAIG